MLPDNYIPPDIWYTVCHFFILGQGGGNIFSCRSGGATFFGAHFFFKKSIWIWIISNFAISFHPFLSYSFDSILILAKYLVCLYLYMWKGALLCSNLYFVFIEFWKSKTENSIRRLYIYTNYRQITSIQFESKYTTV